MSPISLWFVVSFALIAELKLELKRIRKNFKKDFLIHAQKIAIVILLVAILCFTLQKLLESLIFQRGLRTLVVAYKKMQYSEYESLMQNIEQARQIIGAERETHITRAYNLMESGLTLLGVTAVEDRLQDKVQETLECLRVAGIKVSSLHYLCTDYQKNSLQFPSPMSHTLNYRFRHDFCETINFL